MKELTIRDASRADLDDIEEMMRDFVKGHPAEHHPRSRAKLEAALFGAAPVAKMSPRAHGNDERLDLVGGRGRRVGPGAVMGLPLEWSRP
jgi:hypothetical protein